MADEKPAVPPAEEQKPAAEQAPDAAPVAVETETAKPKEEAVEAPSETKPAADAAPAAPADTAAPAEAAPATEPKAEKDSKPEEPAPEAPAPAAIATADAKVEEPTKQPESAPAEATEEAAPEAPKVAPIQELYAAFKAQSHPEIFGVTLEDPESHVPSQIVFQKYLNANDGDLAKAKDQLVKTLEWRATMKPLELVKKTFSKTKFEGLGYVTEYGDASDPEKRAVFTWNVYGAAADRMSETFGNLDEFIEWRVALAELSLARLSIATATKPITAEWDPYKVYQVHDYLSVSFLRRTAEVKASSTKTVAVFNQNYPETLKEKFFVNIPAFMGFMYAFFKLFVAAKTLQKFHPMSNGATLANEFAGSKVDGLGEKLPPAYGGKGPELKGNAEETLLE